MFELDYNKMILLDEEDLAEGGILRAHLPVREILSKYVEPAEIQYVIYSPALPYNEGQSWGRTTHAFFKIVNDQLVKSEYRLYAINGGNDLGGMFLTQAECEAARKSLPRKKDWPYLPTPEHPW